MIINEDSTIHGDCCKFEAMGVCCEKHVAATDCIHKAWSKSSFDHLAYKDYIPTHIHTMVHQLATNDVAGPKLKKKIPASLCIRLPSPKSPALDRLKNYIKGVIDL